VTEVKAESCVIGRKAITYSVSSDSPNYWDFRINSSSGWLVTNATLNYDRINIYVVNTPRSKFSDYSTGKCV